MKKTMQAFFLVLLATAAIFAASRFYRNTHDNCYHEWEVMYKKQDARSQLIDGLAEK